MLAIGTKGLHGMRNQMPGTRIEIPVSRDRNWLSETRFQISGTNSNQIHFHSHMVQENQKRIIFVLFCRNKKCINPA
jgi:hypothetical protein